VLWRRLCPGGDCVQVGTVPGKHGREEMQMKKIIFDCDNTFGVKDCDVDDGLALMYLLGNREAQLLGITSTYGNSSLDVVQAVNLRMLEELGRRDIPVKRGGEKRGCYQSEAAVFLAEMADRHPGELSILATGSLTNLKGAYERDSHFFEKVKEIIMDTINCSEDKITLEANLKDDLGIDSLDSMELMMAVEDAYGITVPEEELPNLTSVKAIVEYVDKNVA